MAKQTIPPLTRALLAFAAGLVAAQSPLLPAPHLLWTATLPVLCWAGFLLLRGKPARQLLPIPLLFLVCGLLFAQSYSARKLPPHHLAHFVQEKQELSLTCRLIDKPVKKNKRIQITVEAESVLFPSGTTPLPASGRARLTINAPHLAGLVPGQFYQVRCRLARPRNTGTPGAFDHAGFLAAQNILVTGWVASPVFIQPVSSMFLAENSWATPFVFEKLRQDIEGFLAAHLEPEKAGFYKALLIGDRSGLPHNDLENFKDTGVMHLLAISGMHLGVLAFLLVFALTRLSSCFPRLYLHLPAFKICLGLSLPLLFFYAGLAGFQPPVLRAFLMAAVFIGAMLCDRQWSSLNNVAIAAFSILLLNPLSILTASFQLSFAATTAIVVVTPRLNSWQNLTQDRSHALRARHLLISAVLISVTAFIATAPLALYHFNRISLLSPLSTLLITPLLCFWALPLGLIAILLQAIFPSLASAVLQAGVLGLDLSRTLTGLLAKLPFASLWLPTPTIAALLAAYLLIFVLFTEKRWQAQLLLSACLALLLTTGFSWPWARGDQALQVSYLDVGQGSATVIRLPDGTITLIDGGGPSSEFITVGESIIAPFLWHGQTGRIDQIILTHAHADHFNGLSFLIRRFRPRTLWLSQKTDQNPEFQALLAEARQAGCQVKIAAQGEILVSAGKERQTAIQCIANLAAPAPEEKVWNHPAGNTNNTGLVLRLTHGRHAFLFPGDIERESEKKLVEETALLDADVLLMPHHGLRSSGSAEFLAAVSPDHIVISRGANTTWRTNENIEKLPAICYTTSRHGSIFITSDGKKIRARSYYPPDPGAKTSSQRF